MKQELIKPIIKLGNSAGVILPKKWLNGKAKVEIVETTTDIKKELLEILTPHLTDIQGIYLAGSYARNEQTSRSDIDAIIITSTIRKKIEIGKYCIIMIPVVEIKRELENNALPILPMLKESKPILNESLIKDYAKTQLTKKNLKWHIELTKSALEVNKVAIDFDKEQSSKYVDDSIAYSLVLRARGTHIVDCLHKNKKYSTREFIQLIRKISSSTKAYEGYLRVKDNSRTKEELPIEEAEKLYDYVIKKIEEQEKWVEKRK